MTITQLIARVWPRMGLPSTNDFFTVSAITDFLNDGYRDFVSQTRCLRKFVLIDSIADQQSYDLPSDSLQPVWFGYNGQGIIPTSVSMLDLKDVRWVGQASGTPAYVTVGLNGLEKFYLYVPPAGSSIPLGNSLLALSDFEDWVDNILLFYEYEIETDLTTGQSPDLEEPFQWALIYYALWQAFESETEWQDVGQAGFWQRRYYEKVEEKKSSILGDTLVNHRSISIIEAGYEEEAYPLMIEWQWKDADEIILEADGVWYYGRQDTDGDFPDGTYKRVRAGDDLVTYRLESGVWVEKVRFFA